MNKTDQAPLEVVDISINLRMIMAARNLTVGDMAAMAGVSKSAMEKYLSGPSSPRATAIASLSNALDIRADFILFGEFDIDQNLLLSHAQGAFSGLLEILKQPGEVADRFASLKLGTDEWRDFVRNLAYERAWRFRSGFLTEQDQMRSSGTKITYL